ncbi:hypothetical protein [Streptomyces sp. CBMA123]|uniref:hypothetical protein n=1 Tax=Streptomyces sp. CBMA123 TaxID=1896313 RepID=UPI001661F7A9|nr:hypothetical protein [Streptomyces sp. CBMA123]MBD0691048.1 hypothetical protein [Streptomyces sp. CBMA123]
MPSDTPAPRAQPGRVRRPAGHRRRRGPPGALHVELPYGHPPMIEALPQLGEAVMEFAEG